jgi:type IX secretion system PorP/SprF family membrane protein
MMINPEPNKSWFKPGHIWKLFISFSLPLLMQYIQAQDIHFSQFNTTPLLTNPAYTGMSAEDLRFSNNYRNQWAKIGAPYNTLYTSLDTRISVSKQSFGIGGLVIHDQSSAFNLSADEFLLSFSYLKTIKNQQFTIGMQPGFVFKAYNSHGLTFGSQFDPSNQFYDMNLPTMENGLNGTLHYFDLNVGVSWRTLIHQIMPSAGISFSHVLRPFETFSTTSSGLRLPVKITWSSQVVIPLNAGFDITPCILYGYTPGAHELVAGSMGGFTINRLELPVKNVYALAMLRSNPSHNIDALIFGGGVKFSRINLGISYDSNISPLSRVTNFNGAFEISLTWTGGNHFQNSIAEPCLIY